MPTKVETIERDISVLDIYEIGLGSSLPTAIHVSWANLVGNGLLDIEISNDRINWNSILDAQFDMTTDDNFLLLEESTPYKFLRINITGATGGTYSVYISQK